MRKIKFLILWSILFLGVGYWIVVSSCGASQSSSTSTTPTTTSVTITTILHNWISNQDALLQVNVAKPAVGSTYTDSVFGAAITRLTDALSEGKPGIIPIYSKRQAWNCDDSLLMLQSGNGEPLLYNGTTGQFVKALDSSVVGGEDIFWHPTDPSLIYYILDNVLYSYDVNTLQRTTLHTFSGYTFVGTLGEGNLSRDGRYCAMVGRTYNTSTQVTTVKDFLVYDIVGDQIIAKESFPAAPEPFDWISISPDGNYVILDYADETIGRYHGVEVYDRNLNFLWQKPLGSGHSDIGVDANGDQVLIMGVYDSATNTNYLKKYKLADGTETILLQFNVDFDFHISCRNVSRPGWCFISTFDYIGRLSDKADNSSLDWLPFEDEVFALKMDGSGAVERYAHHHSRRFSPSTPDSDHSNYWAEPHATVSRQANRILFGSNWRQNVAAESSVDTYLIDLR